MIYFKRNEKTAECAGFLKYLAKLENLRLIALLADVLFIFSRFQKKMQSNDLNLISMKSHIDSTTKSLMGLKNAKLPGAFESNFAKQIVHDEKEDKVYFKSIELQTKSDSRRAVRSINDIRTSILDALCNFLNQRFKCDDHILDKITPFINFDPSTDIEGIHALFAKDLSLPALYTQFSDFSDGEDAMKDLNLNQIILKLCKTSESRDTYNELITVFARIAACTPHSADVERVISANNRLKTKLRSSILVETENNYLYIHMNMPDLAQWNPTAAAKLFCDDKFRRARDMTPANATTRRQQVFKGVFAEARDCKDEEDKGNESDSGHTIFEF